jgi:hypothetical protein
MRHHQTRRRPHLKKQRTTRRRQRGGAEIDSAKAWFTAITEFEKSKDLMGDYMLTTLRGPELPKPPVNKVPFVVRGIDTVYPTPQTTSGEPQDIDLFELSQAVATLFWGEGMRGGLLRQGVNTPREFNKFVNEAKAVPDNMDSSDAFQNKRTVWFLNEIERALQAAADTEGKNDRTLKSIYDKPESSDAKFTPFYIWYLAMNPMNIKDEDAIPVLEGVPK